LAEHPASKTPKMAKAAKTSDHVIYKRLMASAGIVGLTNELALANIAQLIDACSMPRLLFGVGFRRRSAR
jgi:hypothetical protein